MLSSSSIRALPAFPPPPPTSLRRDDPDGFDLLPHHRSAGTAPVAVAGPTGHRAGRALTAAGRRAPRARRPQPPPPEEPPVDDASDLEELLEERLAAYRAFKDVATALRALEAYQQRVFLRPPGGPDAPPPPGGG